MAYPEGLVDLIENLHQQGVNEAVICPGSRNAPIMLALVRHGGFRCYSISDERSAGFFGLGRALKTKRPTIICCTSGSAGLNFAPAVVEAFFQEIPLIVLTADRPAEWIGQWDGQTIYQENLFGKHVKHAESFNPFQPNQLVEKAMAFPQGPVHMNVPITEPFYPTNGEALPQIREPQAIEAHKTPELDTDFQVKQGASLLITVGQRPFNQAENDFFAQLALNGIPVIGDATANLPAECQLHHDLIWANEERIPPVTVTVSPSPEVAEPLAEKPIAAPGATTAVRIVPSLTKTPPSVEAEVAVLSASHPTDVTDVVIP